MQPPKIMKTRLRSLFDKKPPQKGEKVRYKGDSLIYPFFLCMLDRARKNLKVGEVYTVHKSEMNSSWTTIWLEGFEGEDEYFNLSQFEYPIKTPIESVEYESQSLQTTLVNMKGDVDRFERLLQNAEELAKQNKKLSETLSEISDLLGIDFSVDNSEILILEIKKILDKTDD